MVDFLLQTALLYVIAIISAVAVYAVHRRFSLSLWAYLAAFFPEWPVFLELFGAENLSTVTLLSHTVGIVIYPIALIVLDVFLIEASLLRYLKPFRDFLPKGIRKVLKAEEVLERFQRYHSIPTPDRLTSVYAVGVFAGIVHFAFYLFFGA